MELNQQFESTLNLLVQMKMSYIFKHSQWTNKFAANRIYEYKTAHIRQNLCLIQINFFTLISNSNELK